MTARLSLIVSAEVAASLELVPRGDLCRERPACLLRTGHDGACVETARPPYTRPEWEARIGVRDPVGWRETKGTKR